MHIRTLPSKRDQRFPFYVACYHPPDRSLLCAFRNTHKLNLAPEIPAIVSPASSTTPTTSIASARSDSNGFMHYRQQLQCADQQYPDLLQFRGSTTPPSTLNCPVYKRRGSFVWLHFTLASYWHLLSKCREIRPSPPNCAAPPPAYGLLPASRVGNDISPTPDKSSSLSYLAMAGGVGDQEIQTLLVTIFM